MPSTWTAPGASLRAPRCALAGFLLAATAASDGGFSSLIAIPLIAITATFGAACKRDLLIVSQLNPPRKTSRGRRERNARSLADFLSIWLTFLSHLAAVAVCARALSATADHVTAGKSRRWLFGYETRALGEPWPDVLGVTIVIAICAMFMCGLESTSTFTILSWISIAVSSNLLIFIGFAYKIPQPPCVTTSWFQLISSGSICSYAFPTCFTQTGPKSKILHRVASMLTPLCVCMFAAFCVSQITSYREVSGSALPLLRMLEVREVWWAQPLLASCVVVGAGLALTRLCPELFLLLAALAGPDWKVLTRSLTYESSTTGSLVLAVFTAGSLSAILAFACPLSHLMTLMNASPLLAFVVEALLLLVLRCSPSDDDHEQPDVEYKRLSLGKAAISTSPPTLSSASSRSALWFLPDALRQVKSIDNLKQKANKDEKEERECLLLDEYGACGSGVEVLEGGEGEESAGEGEEGSAACAGSGSDTSTDIDAAVEEYRDRVKVVTSAPERVGAGRACSRGGARRAALGAGLALGGAAAAAVALRMQLSGLFIGGTILCVSGGVFCSAQASGASPVGCVGVARAIVSLLLAVLHVAPLLVAAWPAILLFVAAGVVMFSRCTHWCSGLGRVAPTRRLRKASGRRLAGVHSKLGEPDVRRLLPTSLTNGTKSSFTHVDTVYITR